MSVTPLFPQDPPLSARLAARKRFREACNEMSQQWVGQAFSAATRTPEAHGVAIDDAVLVFALAMRRALAEVAG
jgi:hypothetical protein